MARLEKRSTKIASLQHNSGVRMTRRVSGLTPWRPMTQIIGLSLCFVGPASHQAPDTWEKQCLVPLGAAGDMGPKRPQENQSHCCKQEELLAEDPLEAVKKRKNSPSNDRACVASSDEAAMSNHGSRRQWWCGGVSRCHTNSGKKSIWNSFNDCSIVFDHGSCLWFPLISPCQS